MGETFNLIIFLILILGALFSLILIVKMKKKVKFDKQLDDRDSRIKKHHQKMQELRKNQADKS